LGAGVERLSRRLSTQVDADQDHQDDNERDQREGSDGSPVHYRIFGNSAEKLIKFDSYSWVILRLPGCT
jgi:hypothetical protein